MHEKRQNRMLWPVMGFILAVALGIISWFAGPSLMAALPAQLQGLLRRLPGLQGEVYVSIFLFIILLSIGVILVAAFAPKKAINIKDQDIMKQRQELLKYNATKERRQRKIAQENRKALRDEESRRRTREQ
jgi:type VI protein secretion system component VasK